MIRIDELSYFVVHKCDRCSSTNYHGIIDAQQHGSALRWEDECRRCGKPYKIELRYELFDKSDS